MDDRSGSRRGPGRKVVRAMLACLLAALAAGAGCGGDDQAVEWGYDGPGAPENWASLSDEYAACGDGARQSPIDIPAGDAAYEAPPLSYSYSGAATAVRNDGKFAHVDYEKGNSLSIGGRTYYLKSAHFHAPSEHRVGGAEFPAELHVIHADADGNLAVVGVLFELGAPSPAAQAILDAAPNPGDAVDGGGLDASDYMPAELGYYRYDGSKTTPPCDEPVEWYVMRQAKTISSEQVDGILALSDGPTNRPVQPIGDRTITAR